MRSMKLPPAGQIKDWLYIRTAHSSSVISLSPGRRMRSMNLPPGGLIKEHRLSVQTLDHL